MPTIRRSLKRGPRLSSPGLHSMESPQTGLRTKVLARPGRLRITRPIRAERRIAASRSPIRTAPRPGNRLWRVTHPCGAFACFCKPLGPYVPESGSPVPEDRLTGFLRALEVPLAIDSFICGDYTQI